MRRLIALSLLMLALGYGISVSGLSEHFTLSQLQAQFVTHPLQGSLLFILLFILGNIAHVPGLVFLTAAVLALGPWRGGMLTYVAAFCSCCCTFALARLIGADALRQLPGRYLARVLNHIDEHPLRSVLLLRLMAQTQPMLNYALALTGLRFRPYAIGTALGLPLPITVYVLLVQGASDAVLNWLRA